MIIGLTSSFGGLIPFAIQASLVPKDEIAFIEWKSNCPLETSDESGNKKFQGILTYKKNKQKMSINKPVNNCGYETELVLN